MTVCMTQLDRTRDQNGPFGLRYHTMLLLLSLQYFWSKMAVMHLAVGTVPMDEVSLSFLSLCRNNK